ncbi:MAG: hypothetical protein H0X37_21905 [Herpetosiphonaceae bacterium]|nr:hypothetical protein [Herpetosiphonaceae bacterium]
MAHSVTLMEVLPLALQLTPEDQARLVAFLTEAPMAKPEDSRTQEEAAEALDRLREEIGPINILVRELIEEGRYR